jgi:hypothetical protein
MLAVIALHVYGDDGMQRRDQQKNGKDQSEDEARTIRIRFNTAANGCPFSRSPSGGRRAARI